MAVIQDIYNAGPAIGFPGQVANGETSNRISRNVEDAAGIAMTGKAVFAGTSDRGCTATVGTIDSFLGFTMLNHGQPVLPGGPAADICPKGRSVGILALGGINVTAKGTGADRAQVYIEAGTGAITAVVGSNIEARGWRFDDTFTDGQTVRINRR